MMRGPSRGRKLGAKEAHAQEAQGQKLPEESAVLARGHPPGQRGRSPAEFSYALLKKKRGVGGNAPH